MAMMNSVRGRSALRVCFVTALGLACAYAVGATAVHVISEIAGRWNAPIGNKSKAVAGEKEIVDWPTTLTRNGKHIAFCKTVERVRALRVGAQDGIWIFNASFNPEDLARFVPDKRLLGLQLHGGEVRNEHVIQAAKIRSLRYFALDHTSATNACILEIAKLPELEELYLFCNGSMTRSWDPCLGVVSQVPKLQALWVGSQDFSREDLDRFRKARPEVRVIVCPFEYEK